MKHGTIRFNKISQLGGWYSAASRLGHNYRTKDVVNADKAYTPFNEVIIGDSPSEVIEDIRAHLDTVTDKIRGDAILAIEVLCTLTPDCFTKPDKPDGWDAEEGEWLPDWKEMTREEVEGYIKDSINYIVSLYGEKNVVSLVVHRDEGSPAKIPHVHAIIVPLSEKEKSVKRVREYVKYVSPDGTEKTKRIYEDSPEKVLKVSLNAQTLIGGRKLLHDRQTDFYEKVSKKYGLERGKDMYQRYSEAIDHGIGIGKAYEIAFGYQTKAQDILKQTLEDRAVFEDSYNVWLDEVKVKTAELDEWADKLEKRESDLAQREKQIENEKKTILKQREMLQTTYDTLKKEHPKGDFLVAEQLGKVFHGVPKDRLAWCWEGASIRAEQVRNEVMKAYAKSETRGNSKGTGRV